MKLLMYIGLVLLSGSAIAQNARSADSLYHIGKGYMRNGEWANALLFYNRALQQKPDDVNIKKDIAYTYFLQRDFSKALEVIQPIVDGKRADVQSFQIAGSTYKAIQDVKQGKKLYKKALKQHPFSGPLYSEYGELLWLDNNYKEAIKQWEKGILADPEHSGNYYNAAKHYYLTHHDRVWAILYSEIFVNIESYSSRTKEIKQLLLDAYSKFFSQSDMVSNQKKKNNNNFVKQYLSVMNMQTPYLSNGISPSSIMKVREGFIQSWFEGEGKNIPFKLFEYHQQLIDGGMFEAYQQWLITAVANPQEYEKWKVDNELPYDKFNKFQTGRVFKVPRGQYYNY